MQKIIDELRKEAAARGLTLSEPGAGHFKILGGHAVVNYYPTSRRRTAYVDGTWKGVHEVSPSLAVAMACTAPKKKDLMIRKEKPGAYKSQIVEEFERMQAERQAAEKALEVAAELQTAVRVRLPETSLPWESI